MSTLIAKHVRHTNDNRSRSTCQEPARCATREGGLLDCRSHNPAGYADPVFETARHRAMFSDTDLIGCGHVSADDPAMHFGSSGLVCADCWF